MIAKKNSRFDLESKRSSFFQLGLFVTGSITLAAFSYSDPMMRADDGKQVARQEISILYDERVEPKDKTETLVEIPIEQPDDQQQSTVDAGGPVDETSTSTVNTGDVPDAGVNTDLNGVIGGPNLTIGTGIVTISNDIFEMEVDKDAAFVGGFSEMQKFIGSNINYPQEAIEFNEAGIVYMSFVVEKDGSISNVNVEKGVSKALDREAKRIVRAFPEWIPGEIKMQRVRTRVRLPINFVLSN